MSDFAPGDVVVCVDVQRFSLSTGKPIRCALRLRTLYRVLEVTTYPVSLERGLIIDGPPSCSHYGWHVGRFRKIRPADESFTRKVRACRPIKQPARIDAKATS